MTSFTHFLNGSFVPEEKLLISPRDLGFVRGYAVADFIVTYGTVPFKLTAHIDRLFTSAAIIGLRLPWTKEDVRSWARETLDRNDPTIEKTLKIIVSGGISDSMRQADVPTIVMMVSKRKRHQKEVYEKGIKVVSCQYRRPFPKAKHTYYVEAIRQLAEIDDPDVQDVIYYDTDQVYEGSGTNLFAVIENKLVTPQSHIVEGVTRNTLLEILSLSIPVEVRDFSFEELRTASELFLTGSNSEVRGVVEMDGNKVGNGKVGEVTREVLRQYRAYVEKYGKSTK
jgi:branched-subunit amino acid aminotransferase/4-amino-4-deoxychorismate lyase